MTQTNHALPNSVASEFDYIPASPAVVVEAQLDDSGRTKGYVVQIDSRGRRGYLPWYNLPRWNSPLNAGDTVAVLAQRGRRRRMPTLIHPEALIQKKGNGSETLMQLLRCSDSAVRRMSLDVCEELISIELPAPVFETIADRLEDADARVRFAAIRMISLTKRAEDFTAPLTATMRSDSLPTNQAAAMRALESLGIDADEVLDAFELLVRHGHPSLRAGAWRALNTVAPDRADSHASFEEYYRLSHVASLNEEPTPINEAGWTLNADSDDWQQLQVERRILENPLPFLASIHGRWGQLPDASKWLARSVCIEQPFVTPVTCGVFTEMLLNEEPRFFPADELQSQFPDEATAESMMERIIRDGLSTRPEWRERLCTIATSSAPSFLRRIALRFVAEWPQLNSSEADAIVSCILDDATRTAALEAMANLKNSAQIVLPRLLNAMALDPSTFSSDPSARHFSFFEQRVIAEYQHSFRLVEDSLTTN